MNLTPLRELEPTLEEIARVRALAAAPEPPRRRRRPRPVLALATVSVAAGIAAAAALPGAESATSALRAAAAAAADEPAPRAFTGYRYVEMIDRRTGPWATYDEECMKRFTQRLEDGTQKSGMIPCPRTASVTFTSEGRVEMWVDKDWKGTVRNHGSRVTEVTGDPVLAEAVRRELGREPMTHPYVYGDGPYAHAPVEDLPTEPAALLEVLTAAYEDGRWSDGGKFRPLEGSQVMRTFELARYTSRLLIEANASPALRGAAFGVLARMPGVKDLGEMEDSRGREGHGIEIAGPVGAGEFEKVRGRLRLVFDPDQGELLSLAERQTRGVGEVEWVLLKAEHVRTKP
jgi:hypothetical protein